MRKDFCLIRDALREIAEQEATYLYRLAWRMTKHGCSPKNIQICREEANALHMTGYPERLITHEAHNLFKYAFKIE